MSNYTDIDNIIDLTPSAMRHFIHDPENSEERRVALWLETKATTDDLDTIGHEVCNHEWEVWQALTEAVCRVAKRMMEED